MKTDRELLELAAKAAGSKALLNPIGEVYGRLRVVAEVERTNPRKRQFRCICECGSVVDRNLNALRSGHTRSCGCLHAEAIAVNMAKRSKGHTKHGRHGSPEYGCWIGMRQRCLNPRNRNFKHYGGRGITICAAWLESFDAFFADMGPRPEGHSLDRINVDGNYEPGNVRWATQQQQAENTRVVRMLTLNGKTQSIAAWSREMGLSLGQVQSREKAGWSTEDAILTPSIPGQKRVKTVVRDYSEQPRGWHGRYKAG